MLTGVQVGMGADAAGFQPRLGALWLHRRVPSARCAAPGARGRAVVSGGSHHSSSLLPHHAIISSPFGVLFPLYFNLHNSCLVLALF